MAHRRALALGKNRLFDRHRPASPAVTLPLPLVPPNSAATNFHRHYISPPESSSAAGEGGASFFRRFLHRRAIGQKSPALPEFLSLPVGDKLRERLRRINISGDRTNSLAPPPTPTPEKVVAGESVNGGLGLSVRDAKKVLRIAQVEKVKAILMEIPETAIPYADFVRICGEACGGDEDRGLEFAKLLDDSGNVIVLGSIVYLRPDQVAKSMEAVLAKTVSFPGDPRRIELEEMERLKSKIDERARAQVRGELYCGLGLLALQTLGFMRLTFWELSWDVMEPICFFVTSLHFAGAYVFFLRTATEPSFEGYFRRRFETKQRRLMELHGFDFEKYEELRRACRGSISTDRFRAFGSEGGSFVGVVDR